MLNKLFYILMFVLSISCTQQKHLSVDEIPDSLPEFNIIVDSGNVFDGYIFLRNPPNPGAQIMIDSQGKIVWFHLSDTTIIRVSTPYEKSYLALYKDKEIHEITYAGDTLLKLTYGTGGFDKPLHHEIILDDSDNIVSLTKEIVPYDLSRFGGKEKDTLTTDGIIVLSRTGKQLWHWSFTSVLDTMKSSTETAFQVKTDWAHANALFIDDDGNYLVSWRDLDQIWKINSNSGDIMWKYGAESIQQKNNRFNKQHNIHKDWQGNYMLFDNGPNRINRPSRAVMFKDFGDSIGNTFTINLPDSVSTRKQGSVYQFAEDKYLFSVPRTNDLIITNKKGDVLWWAQSDTGFYRAYYVHPTVLD